MFTAFKANYIRKINLNSNNLQLLNFSWFSNMSHLQNLRVSFNKISTIMPEICLFISTIIIFLKCNTNIKNLLYLLKVKQFRRQGYLPIVNSDDYEYHAFVVYCDENRIWVHDDFVKKLENEEGFKFCIYHRDFDVEESVSGNVDKYLKKSWKVVVIISNAFAKSEWCQWEVDIIQERRR
ncbi:toll-like receptor 4 [Mytilus californianus]|uniref:toll-like receptor 4 n=1 Tax=Mytilus californianus TaxID=6549 RepID=UPI00224519F8|nr:toll-like receptor 4 [Mytilus californianus]